jgi:hypothetical protein
MAHWHASSHTNYLAAQGTHYAASVGLLRCRVDPADVEKAGDSFCLKGLPDAKVGDCISTCIHSILCLCMITAETVSSHYLLIMML